MGSDFSAAPARCYDFSQFPNTFDVGLVILPKPGVSLSTYGALPPAGLLASLSGQDKPFTAVGYGMQGLIKPFESDIFARFQGTTRLIEVNSTFNGDDQSAKFTNNPARAAGPASVTPAARSSSAPAT